MTQIAPDSARRSRRDPEPEPFIDLDPTSPPGGRRQRGRHATPEGQGFGWVVGWTIIGTMFPGTGLVAAGRRVVGFLVIGAEVLLLAATVTFVLYGDPMAQAQSLLTSTNNLIWVAAAIGVIALVWALIVLGTHSALRRSATLSGTQKIMAAALVTALIAVGVMPAAKGASYALLTRDAVNTVLGSSTPVSSDARRPTAGPAADPWAGIPRVNVLFLGSDAGADRIGIRPDTMIVASINTRTGDTVLLSLPRSLQHVPFPPGSPQAAAYPNGYYCVDASGVPQCLLNAMWTFGKEHANTYYKGDPHPGLTATVQAAEQVTGLKIDNFVMLNLQGFQAFVDAIGGVTVTIHERLPVGGNKENPHPSSWLLPGRRHLNGYFALWFARSRFTTDDYDRMRRQRCVIGAVVQQADPVQAALNFDKIANAAKNNITTDITKQELNAWVTLALRVKKAHVRSLPFTTAVINTVDPNYSKIHRLVQQALTAPVEVTPTPTLSATPSPGSSKTHPKPSPSPVFDPSAAQDIKTVC